MRLGFHYHIPFHQSEKGEIFAPGYLGVFLDSLAARVDELVCFMHSSTEDQIPYSEYRLQSPNLRWVNVGPWTSVPTRMLLARRYTQPLREQRLQMDALLIRGPSPLLPAMARAAHDTPIALLLVGDYLAGVNDLPQPRWRKEAIRAWSYWNYRQQRIIAREALTFVNSRQLFDQFRSFAPHLIETRTTTLSVNDFFEREDTCQQRPVRLLYTGRIDRAKGLFEMVEAIQLLEQQGYDVILDLVGWPAKGDTIVEELIIDAGKRGVSDCITFHGYKAVGSELNAFYKQADIYVIASQSSEGFPRTIWEAMAHSLPVVATPVGSIAYYLEDNESAVLIEPRSPAALAAGIASLLHDSNKRRKLISNGLAKASENTLEQRATELVNGIERWVREISRR